MESESESEKEDGEKENEEELEEEVEEGSVSFQYHFFCCKILYISWKK